MHGFFQIDDSESDRQLIKGIEYGDTAAFEKLYKKYIDSIYSYLLTRCSNQSDIMDIIQETFLSIWKCCGSYQGQSKLITWIIGIARNKLNDHFRKTYRSGNSLPLDESLDSISEAQPADLEAGIDMESALDMLSAPDRELVYMVFNLEMKYSEIAFILKIPEGTVKSRMSRIRKQLAHVLRSKTEVT